ncbi:MAG: T9SS type A sorting domain-containing protein [Bacteroidia bacterium]
MKKGLLLTLAIGTTLGATAQNARMANPNAKMVKMSSTRKVANDVSKPLVGTMPVKTIVNSPLMASSAVPLGSGPNAYSVTAGNRSYLWADPVLNAVVFSHRLVTSAPAIPTSGCVGFDVSTDGGATWTVNQGPVYTGLGQSHATQPIARYPQSVIVNVPSTNTNPANAQFSYFSANLDGTNGASWGGVGYGTSMLDGTMSNQTNIQSGNGAGKMGGYSIIPDDFFVTRQGVLWGITESDSATIDYSDTLLIFKGTVSGMSAPTYQITKLPMNVIKDGTRGIISSQRIAFDETGMIGYISFLGALPDPALFSQADSSSYIVLLKTTDGGATWGAPKAVIPATFAVVKDSLPQLDAGLGQIGVYGCAFDMDMVVDKYGNPHFQTGVGVSVKEDNSGPNANYSAWSFASGNFAQFAFYSTDGGVTFKAHMLARPQTFRGCFGTSCPATSSAITEDQRPGVSVSWDGKTIVHTWFDTDTLTAGVSDNTAPSVHSLGLVLDSACEIWGTQEQNLTPGGQAGSGEVVEGCVSYYLMPGTTPGSYNVPVSYSQLATGPDVTLAVQYQYLHGLEYTDAAFANACVTGIKTVANVASASVTPNPTTGVALVSYNLTANATVTAEVYNILGEKLAVVANENQVAGKHNLNIDLSKYNNGLYVVRMNVNGVNTTVKVVKN